MTFIPFHEICKTRQQVCLVILDKVITSPPSEAKYYVNKYNTLEKRWKKYDEQHGFPHDVFLKMNNHFKENLNCIIDEMFVKFLKQQSLILKLSKDSKHECIFCFEFQNKKDLNLFVCKECKNSCHLNCILEWMGERLNQGCPFCRKIIWGEEK